VKPKTALITAAIAVAVYLGLDAYKARSGAGKTRIAQR
jgi:hypothetical protein